MGALHNLRLWTVRAVNPPADVPGGKEQPSWFGSGNGYFWRSDDYDNAGHCPGLDIQHKPHPDGETGAIQPCPCRGNDIPVRDGDSGSWFIIMPFKL